MASLCGGVGAEDIGVTSLKDGEGRASEELSATKLLVQKALRVKEDLPCGSELNLQEEDMLVNVLALQSLCFKTSSQGEPSRYLRIWSLGKVWFEREVHLRCHR